MTVCDLMQPVGRPEKSMLRRKLRPAASRKARLADFWDWSSFWILWISDSILKRPILHRHRAQAVSLCHGLGHFGSDV